MGLGPGVQVNAGKRDATGKIVMPTTYNAAGVAGAQANGGGYYGGGLASGGSGGAAPSIATGWQDPYAMQKPPAAPQAAPQTPAAPPQQMAALQPPPQQQNNAPPGEGYGPGFGEQYGKSHIGQYDQPTSLETFAQQQLNGTNPYYDRLRSQGMDAINQQMIARGHGNSGGALASLGNFAGALGAAQFNDMGSLLGSAGSMGLNRMNQGQNVANSVQGMQQQRTGQQWGQLSDMAHLGAGLTGGFYGQGGQMSGDAAMSGINAGANAAQLQGQGQSALPNMAMQGLNAYLAK